MAPPLGDPVTLTETLLRALSLYEELRRAHCGPSEARERTISTIGAELSQPSVKLAGMLCEPGEPRWFREFQKQK